MPQAREVAKTATKIAVTEATKPLLAAVWPYLLVAGLVGVVILGLIFGLLIFFTVTSNTDRCVGAPVANVATSSSYVPGKSDEPNPTVIAAAYERAMNFTVNGRKASERVILGLFEAGETESGWRNYANSRIPMSLDIPHDAVGNDHWSVGFLQTQTGPNGEDNFGWGTAAHNMIPARTAEEFLKKAIPLDRTFTGTAGNLVQTIWVSRSNAYDSHEAAAKRTLARARAGDFGPAPTTDAAITSTAGNGCCVGTPIATAPAAVSGSSTVIWPVPGHDTSTYPGHDGVDINRGAGALDLGDTIVAAASGVVDYVGTGHGYGEAIFIRTDLGPVNIYGHTRKQFVQAGERVAAGQKIGEVGNTGRSSAPHLHFGVKPGLSYQASMDFLKNARPFREPAAQPVGAIGNAAAQATGAGPTITVRVSTWNSAHWADVADTIDGARALAADSDVIGWQELSGSNKQIAVELALGSSWKWTSFRNQTKIAYNADRFELVKEGQRRAFKTQKVESVGGKNYYNEKFVQWVILRDRATGAQFAVLNSHAPNAIESKGQPNKKHPIRVGMAAQLFRTVVAIAREEIPPNMPMLATFDTNVDELKALALRERGISPAVFPDAILGTAGFVTNYGPLGFPNDATHGHRYIDNVYFTPATVTLMAQRTFPQSGSDHGGLRVTATINATSASCTGAEGPAVSAVVDGSLSDPGPGPQDCSVQGADHCLTPRAENLRRIVESKFGCDVAPEAGCVRSIGGWRASDPVPDHPAGLGLDLMVNTSGAVTPAEKKGAEAEAAWLRTNATQLGVQYLIFDEKIWNKQRDAEGWRQCGTPAAKCYAGPDNDAAHRTHIHVSLSTGPKAAAS